MPSTIRGTDNFDTGQRLTQMTAQSSTSGTAIDFTGIPSWAKRITVMFNGVSSSGTSPFLVQVGSGSITSTGYTSTASDNGGATNFSTGFGVLKVSNAGYGFSGHCTITAFSASQYIQSGVVASNNNAQTTSVSGGNVTLSGVLDRIRITTVNGTDTFDAGSVNILYE